jgi:hypothetical protein
MQLGYRPIAGGRNPKLDINGPSRVFGFGHDSPEYAH